ncbi:FtsK/SpoIIIE domain-containing protein [Tsukamurella paurometabola]|uniref:FtsK domain-containing protein n=1 Tax=Tsukamurella paurometabola TaxID=2061 RepID=A0ABS5NFQ9_TSUPA|nr:FtsK/SpoIIIE domain-containing protein [Tsukamurella paurometabola]MBS4102865.1 hypothetical protein [Tsukamurella paurometabola]
MSTDSEFSFLFEGLDDEPRTEESGARADAGNTVEQKRDAEKAAEAQERALLAEADRYEAMLPEIAAAQPLPAQPAETSAAPRLSGAEWVAEGVRQTLTPRDPSRYSVTVKVVEGSVVAWVTGPAGVDRDAMAHLAVQRLRDRGNLGEFQVHLAADPRTVILQRSGVGGSVSAWSSHGTRARLFFETEEGRDKVFDLAGLYQTNKRTKARRYAGVRAFGEDHRGGTATLRLRPGMTLAQVKSAEGKLRQLFRAPDLIVDAAPGSVDPIIHLNTKPIARELPATNPLAPERLVRVRTRAERFAAAPDFVLPVGVRIDDETGEVKPILVNQDAVPHAAVFGGTGSGKTVLLSMMVRAAVLQGAEVVLWDAKMGKDMRALAFDRSLPGVIHYAAGSAAVLHRTVLWVRHEYERRQALAERLAYRGIEYRPTPLLLVMDELPWWIDGLKARKGDHLKAAEQTEAHISAIAAEARELRVFFIVAGQYAYVSGYSGAIRTNTQTLISVGPPKKINMDNLFATPDEKQRAVELSATIRKQDKGVGVMLDDSTNEVVKFRGFFNAPDLPEAARFADAVAQVPRLRRFAYALPRGDMAGGDGSWAEWTPVTDPSSDSLPTRVLDGPDGQPLLEAEIDDPTSTSYRPGRRPQPQVHANPN